MTQAEFAECGCGCGGVPRRGKFLPGHNKRSSGWREATTGNPSGVCMCGCGERTEMSPYTDRPRGYVKGQPMRYARGHQGKPVEERFWALVERGGAGECWPWGGSTNNGYGQISVRSRHVLAHRLAYELLVGPIPDGLQLDHLCRNRACVNPAHLEPVTIRENVLRGVGLTAQAARKTHCVRGHELAGDNIYVRNGGRTRQCKRCLREREIERSAT